MLPATTIFLFTSFGIAIFPEESFAEFVLYFVFLIIIIFSLFTPIILKRTTIFSLCIIRIANFSISELKNFLNLIYRPKLLTDILPFIIAIGTCRACSPSIRFGHSSVSTTTAILGAIFAINGRMIKLRSSGSRQIYRAFSFITSLILFLPLMLVVVIIISIESLILLNSEITGKSACVSPTDAA
ncbi:MAG: hypothetical protein BWY84_00230 [Candidatus Aerophobetes bacterium ADurb.Bin490]|nr:MAG: hypothetical protein BWY84_00230 [Candidatus Aerophobetes bacterium ADurb.Bin490]